MKKFFEFIGVGIITPFIYLIYSASTILLTFLFGLPIGIGIYFIQLAMNWLLTGG